MTDLLNKFIWEYLPKNYPELYKKARVGQFYAFPQDDGTLSIGLSESECTPEEINKINEAWTVFYRSEL